MKPLRDDALAGVHQVPNRLQNSFEVVLLRLPSHEQVEAFVDVIAAFLKRFHVMPVLIGVEPDSVSSFITRQLRARFDAFFDDFARLVKQTFDFAAADIHESHLLDEVPSVVVFRADRCVRMNSDEEANVVTPQVLPFVLDLLSDIQRQGNVSSHSGRLLLSDPRLPHFHNGEILHWQRHSSPAAEDNFSFFVGPRKTADDRVFDILPDFVCLKKILAKVFKRKYELTSRFQPEEIEVPVEIIVKRQELEVQLGQRQATVAGVILVGNDILIPDDAFVGVKRHLVERFQLGNPALVSRDLREPKVSV